MNTTRITTITANAFRINYNCINPVSNSSSNESRCI